MNKKGKIVNAELVAEKLKLWLCLDDEEKRKYNGYTGFVSGKRYIEDNAFLKFHQDKLSRRRIND